MTNFSNTDREADLTPELRKSDHIEIALSGRVNNLGQDKRFNYEPLLMATPQKWMPFTFLGKTFNAPFWVSSMTGGTQNAGEINRTLAMVAARFGFGMGLGSCRSLLYSKEHLADFAMRRYLGDRLPLYANLGIAQVESLVINHQWDMLRSIVQMTEADGLIIHINPIQEWLQKGGDKLTLPPIDTIKKLLDKDLFPLIVKEVGQGFGPESTKALLSLPLKAIEFAAQGGTNFGAIEELRKNDAAHFSPLVHVGHSAEDMVDFIRTIRQESSTAVNEFIISGGIKNFLDGYYCMQRLHAPAVIGQASAMLRYALLGEEALSQYVAEQLSGLLFAQAYLKVKE